uniref:Uncharacterized protein n=1 Tax=Heterorhabditis bacteriophora TaxID=37862 RepID=A0A1I7WR43_HETBA
MPSISQFIFLLLTYVVFTVAKFERICGYCRDPAIYEYRAYYSGLLQKLNNGPLANWPCAKATITHMIGCNYACLDVSFKENLTEKTYHYRDCSEYLLQSFGDGRVNYSHTTVVMDLVDKDKLVKNKIYEKVNKRERHKCSEVAESEGEPFTLLL